MAPRGRPTRTTRSRPVTATPPPVTATPPPVTDPTTTTSVTSAQLQAMIDEGVTAVLAARATTRNGDDSHTSGTGARRNERTVRECTYQDFMKCQPLFFRGTEGAVNLTQWFERMETVFRISNCTVENQVKFATCTLMGTALTWWNSHARTVTNEVAYAMTWSDLKKKMTTKYCPRNEIKKIEVELWNLKVKGTDVVAYNQRFQELALLCDRMFPEETDKIERYVGGMPDPIYSSVVASKPKTMQEAIEMATELMDRRNNTFAERQAENKRKFEDTPRNNQTQQPNKRQNTGRAYAAGNGDRKPYEGAKPRCPKCNFNHYGPCTPKCTNCKKLGHLAKDCRSRPATANNNNNRNNNNNNNRNNNNPRAQGANTNAIVCFECGAPGHFRNNCPQWKNKNQGNGNGVARAYAVGVAGQNPDNNVVTGTFLLNNRCASILFDTGADRSFVSTQFSTLINIAPTTLDHGYNVELADGRIIWVNTDRCNPGAVLLVVAWSPTLKANDGIGICPLGSRVVVVAVVVVILHGLGSTVLGKVDKLLALLPMLVLQGRNGGSYTWVIEVKSLLYGFCHRSPCQHKPCLRHLNSLLLWLFGFVAQHWSNSDPSGIPSDNTFNFVMSLQETSVTQQCQPITERHSISHLFPRYVPNIALSLV
ncbi:putative reverse transcriptase domain-containing protein [Tanacetum coccineum]